MLPFKESSPNSTHHSRSGIDKTSAVANNDRLKSDGSWILVEAHVNTYHRSVQVAVVVDTVSAARCTKEVSLLGERLFGIRNRGV